LKLPPRDSVESRIQVELLNRERWEKVTQWEVTAKAIGYFLGQKPAAVQQCVDMLKTQLAERVFHHGYDTADIRAQLLARLQALKQESSYLDKLDKMTV
jgi:hypothetical protein